MNAHCNSSKKICDICGNGVRKPPEVCDDQSQNDGSGCASNCLSILPTWICSGGTPASKDSCTPKHGDGKIVGSEECDDGNLNDFDGCSAAGLTESHFTCSGLPSVCVLCGNGAVENSEQCDDGNFLTGDGCNSECKIEIGYECHQEGVSVCSPQCGDGRVIDPEICDAGKQEGCADSCSKV